MTRSIRTDDEGKRVLTADGDEVGTVDRVDGSTAHVRATDDLSRSVRRRLDWAGGTDTYELRASAVDAITSDEVWLKRDL